MKNNKLYLIYCIVKKYKEFNLNMFFHLKSFFTNI